MQIIHKPFNTLVSTNDWSKENIASFDRSSLTIVTTGEQTGGRGQYGRKWIAPSRLNIYASFCFFIDENQQDPLSLTHVMAISAATMLGEKGVHCRIKWPNDVLVNQKKIAGILCETVYFPGEFGVIIGIGLNVNMPPEILATISQPATSMYAETGSLWEVDLILKDLQLTFVRDLTRFLKSGFEPFAATFRQFMLISPVKTNPQK